MIKLLRALGSYMADHHGPHHPVSHLDEITTDNLPGHGQLEHIEERP